MRRELRERSVAQQPLKSRNHHSQHHNYGTNPFTQFSLPLSSEVLLFWVGWSGGN
jgi:hypothetical protein